MLLGASDYVLDGVFGFGRKVTENGAVQGDDRRWRSIGGIPIWPQQGGEQCAAFLIERGEFGIGDLGGIGVGFSMPPFLLGGGNFSPAPTKINLIDIGDDDVADGLFGAADVVEVGDVGGVVGGFQFLPGEELFANDDAGQHLVCADNGRGGNRHGRRLGVTPGRQPKHPENHVDNHRQYEQGAPAHANQ